MEMALRLAKVFGSNPVTKLGRQMVQDASTALARTKAVSEERFTFARPENGNANVEKIPRLQKNRTSAHSDEALHVAKCTGVNIFIRWGVSDIDAATIRDGVSGNTFRRQKAGNKVSSTQFPSVFDLI